MSQWKKDKLELVFNILLLILVVAISVAGPVIATIHQYNLIVQEFGRFYYGVRISNSWDWFYATVLVWLPYNIYVVMKIQQDRRETINLFNALIKISQRTESDLKENKNDKQR